jgi:hypothetical protein
VGPEAARRAPGADFFASRRAKRGLRRGFRNACRDWHGVCVFHPSASDAPTSREVGDATPGFGFVSVIGESIAERRCVMMVVSVGITSEEMRSLAGKADRRSGRAPGGMQCLVVSGDSGFRGRLGAVSDLSECATCATPVDVAELAGAIDGDYQLVIVDIAHPLGDRVNDTVEVAEEFASRPGTLLVVCGSEDSVEEELWARQLGAWVYLPGVSSGDALVSLFAEARRVGERRGVMQLA